MELKDIIGKGCPNCGSASLSISWEIDTNGNSKGNVQLKCGNCGRVFALDMSESDPAKALRPVSQGAPKVSPITAPSAVTPAKPAKPATSASPKKPSTCPKCSMPGGDMYCPNCGNVQWGPLWAMSIISLALIAAGALTDWDQALRGILQAIGGGLFIMFIWFVMDALALKGKQERLTSILPKDEQVKIAGFISKLKVRSGTQTTPSQQVSMCRHCGQPIIGGMRCPHCGFVRSSIPAWLAVLGLFALVSLPWSLPTPTLQLASRYLGGGLIALAVVGSSARFRTMNPYTVPTEPNVARRRMYDAIAALRVTEDTKRNAAELLGFTPREVGLTPVSTPAPAPAPVSRPAVTPSRPATPSAYTPAVARSSGPREADNRGTRHEDRSVISAYWTSRLNSSVKDPYVLYLFETEKSARDALLTLPCIKVAEDSKKLICTEPLIYGYYPAEADLCEAVLAGEALTYALYEQARTAFTRYGGMLKSELAPDKNALPPAQVYLEKDNLGTRHDTLSKASAYWIARMSMVKKDPFVMYTFDTASAARSALLELPCIKVAQDTQKLICTEVLIFGYYDTEKGGYEALICGDDLTEALWQQAHDAFTKHGGKKKNDLKPERATASPAASATAAPDKVVFDSEERQQKMGVTFTYRYYKGPDAASAKAFLERNPVTQKYYYVIVETPEGNYGRDIDGIYKE